jgi:spore photoproduct lyase
MKPFRPEQIFIDEQSLEDTITTNVLNRFTEIPYEIIKPGETVPDEFKVRGGGSKTISSGKRILYLRHNRGKFIEQCPGTRDAHICCNYLIASIIVNCHLDCTYCFLQSYLTERYITLNTNVDDFLNEIDSLVESNPGKKLRIGTGELADSLALDEFTGFSKSLVPFFADKENLLLELKTKGNYVDNLLAMDPRGKSVISWSLNPPGLISSEEFKTSSLPDRLEAARKCRDAGYKIAFHFDPIILHSKWEENYRTVVKSIYDYVDENDILWISMGVLRFTPYSRTAIENRFPNSTMIYEEMVQCADGKLRYSQKVRTEIYRKMTSWIREFDNSVYIYLCMESPAVWERTFGPGAVQKMNIENF